MDQRDRILETFLRSYVCAGRNIKISGIRVGQAICDRSYQESLIFGQVHGTGSMYEGLPVEVCNDMDFMQIHKDNPVVVHQQPHVAPPQGLLIYDINPSNQAYLTLRTVPGVEYRPWIQGCIQQSGYLSSSRFVTNAFHGDIGIHETHGPAGVGMVNPANPEYGTQDFVLCLSCLSWPPCASEFLTRPRQHGWPPQSLIDKIQQAGCHVVPVGHPQSENKDIEWRWSLSVAERELLHNISDKMFMVMYALKAIKNKHWRHDESEVTIFCSYFIKTACLWVGEETDQSNISMMDLCRKVIDWLVTCYRTHRLPHYFIPTQNLIGHLEKDLCNVASSWLLKTRQQLDKNTITPLCMHQSLEAVYLRLVNQPVTNISDDVLLSILDTDIKKCVNITYYMMMRNAEGYITDVSDGSVQEAVKAGMVLSYIAHVLEKIIIAIISDLPNLVKPGHEQTFRTLLYRKLGDLYQSLTFYSTKLINMNVDSIIPSLSGLTPKHGGFYILCFEVYKSIIVGSESLYYDKTIDYYTQGLELVYPDSWSDRGLGGYVRLATFYHLNGEREKLGETMEKLEPVLDWGRKNDVNRIVGIIYINKNLSISTLPWKQDQELYTNVIEACHDLYACINPVVLGYYLLIRWLMDDKSQEEQTSETRHKIEENVSNIKIFVTELLVFTAQELESTERILQIFRNLN